MRIALLIAFFISLSAQAWAQQAHYGNHDGIELPDDQVTPGAIAITSPQVIIGTKWREDHRHVTDAMKAEACRAYGITSGCPGKAFEIDHRVPRCAGGADDRRNLWAQRGPEFGWKDRLEKRVCRDIKKHKIGVPDAQAMFLGDWVDGYIWEFGKMPGK